MRPAHPRQTIDAGAKIDARHRHQDAHLRRELNHGDAAQPDRHNCNTTSVAALGAISSCSLSPFGPCSDNRHPLVLTGSDNRHPIVLTGSAPANSMNFTALRAARALLPPPNVAAAPLTRLSLLYSSPRARAVT